MRRRVWMQLPMAAVVALGGWMNGALLAGNGCDCSTPETTCGCAAPAAVCCRKHCCHHHGRRNAPVQWAAQPPAGPVVASMAAPAFTTYSSVNLVAADYGLVRPMSLVQMAPAGNLAAAQAGHQSTESSCQGNSARIRDLEDRIDLLQQRLTKVQTNVDEQTEILREIASRVKSLPRQ